MKLVLVTLLVVLGNMVLPVSAFRRRFGIFSAAVSSTTDGLYGHKRNSSRQCQEDSSSWLHGWELDDNDECGRVLPDKIDDDKDDEELLDALQLHPLLQIPSLLALTGVLQAAETPVRTFVDTGAMRTVMSWDMASQLGVLQHLDRRYGGHATGIGSCRVMGRLPAGLFTMQFTDGVTVSSPVITILESTGLPGVELLLGLDFLREYRAVLDLRNDELRILVQEEEHVVPFIQPRGGVPETVNEKDDYWNVGVETPDSHYDTSQLYNEHYLDQPTDEEDWPDMSGV